VARSTPAIAISELAAYRFFAYFHAVDSGCRQPDKVSELFMKTVELFSIIIAFATSSVAQSAGVNASKMYEINVTLKNVPTAGSKQSGETLADPVCMSVANSTLNLDMGRDETLGKVKVPVGTKLTAKMIPHSPTTVRVIGVLESSEAEAAEEGIVRRASSSIYIDKVVELGKRLRTHVSKSEDSEQWFEMSVVEATGNESKPRTKREQPTCLQSCGRSCSEEAKPSRQ
jgi:hypothetical protein